MVMSEARLRAAVRSIPDFPKKGIVFRDITTLLQNPEAFRSTIDLFYDRYRSAGIEVVAGIESRGFIIGGALAYRLGVGFVPVRKPRKLPFTVVREEYKLEYGTDAVEIHTDAVAKGQKVLIVDDLIATGGTVLAAAHLIEKLGATVAGLAFLIELAFLNGRSKLGGYDIYSLISYDSE